MLWFQSTHSLWSATAHPFHAGNIPHVSIHALLVECDVGELSKYIPSECFNPRTPCGVRLTGCPSAPTEKPFQSTHSLWSATKASCDSDAGVAVSIHALLVECDTIFLKWPCTPNEVSIHALLVECDFQAVGINAQILGFNPRTPCGVRHNRKPDWGRLVRVSIHALLVECDTYRQVPWKI